MDGDKQGSASKTWRTGRTKARSGCRTCKIRRVKCDEARPACNRCVSTGRVCDGYGIWGGGGNGYGSDARRANLPPVNLVGHGALRGYNYPVPIFDVSREEKVCFEYFRRYTALKLPGVFDSNFWDTLVFQASTTEPAVLHAAIALGSAHRSEVLNSRGSKCRGSSQDVNLMDRHELFALQQYNKAISHLQLHFSTRAQCSLRIALITCMVFVCLEMLRGQYMTGNAHLQNGLKILSEIQGREFSKDRDTVLLRPQPESIDDYLIEAFARLNIQSALFGNGSQHLFIVAQNLRSGPESQIPDVFKSVCEARQHLDGLINGVYLLMEQCCRSDFTLDQLQPAQVQHQQRLHAGLSMWIKTFQASLGSLVATSNPRTALGLPLLRMHYTMASIIINTCLYSTHEIIYDSHIPDFTSIIVHAIDLWKSVSCKVGSGFISNHCVLSSLGFTVDMGFIPPLYYTGLKCRVPRIRRQAMKMLLSAPHREGVWDGTIVAFILGRVMAMEEGDFYKDYDYEINHDIDIFTVPGPDEREFQLPVLPQAARIHEVRVVLPDAVKSSATLVCKRRGHEGGWEAMTTEFDFTAVKMHRPSSQSESSSRLPAYREREVVEEAYVAYN